MTVAHVPLNHWFYWVLMNISNEIEDLDVYMSLHPTNVYIYTELFCKGRENGILFVYKIPANLTVRKGHHIFAFSCTNNSCICKFCNKLVALKNSLLPCYFANYYDSDASILRELKKKAFFRGILFEFTDNVPISCGKCNFGKTQNILESVRINKI